MPPIDRNIFWLIISVFATLGTITLVGFGTWYVVMRIYDRIQAIRLQTLASSVGIAKQKRMKQDVEQDSERSRIQHDELKAEFNKRMDGISSALEEVKRASVEITAHRSGGSSPAVMTAITELVSGPIGEQAVHLRQMEEAQILMANKIDKIHTMVQGLAGAFQAETLKQTDTINQFIRTGLDRSEQSVVSGIARSVDGLQQPMTVLERQQIALSGRLDQVAIHVQSISSLLAATQPHLFMSHHPFASQVGAAPQVRVSPSPEVPSNHAQVPQIMPMIQAPGPELSAGTIVSQAGRGPTWAAPTAIPPPSDASHIRPEAEKPVKAPATVIAPSVPVPAAPVAKISTDASPDPDIDILPVSPSSHTDAPALDADSRSHHQTDTTQDLDMNKRVENEQPSRRLTIEMARINPPANIGIPRAESKQAESKQAESIHPDGTNKDRLASDVMNTPPTVNIPVIAHPPGMKQLVNELPRTETGSRHPE